MSFFAIDVISEIAGTLIYASGNWRRRAIEDNLKSFGASNYSIRMVFVNMTKNHLELLKLGTLRASAIRKLTEEPEGFDYNVLKMNSMIFSAHYGSWELAPMFISSVGMKSCTVAEFRNVGSKMYGIMESFRSRHGMLIFPLEDMSTPLKIRDALKEGHTPILLVDRDITKSGMPVKMGGRTLLVPKGAFVMAKKFRTDCFVGVFKRNSSDRFRFKLELEDVGIPSSSEDAAQITIDIIARTIKADPEQWFAFDLNWGI